MGNICLKLLASLRRTFLYKVFWYLLIYSWVILYNTFTERCSWRNGYCHWKWTWQLEFKSWTRQFAFHKALIPFWKVGIQLFYLWLWVNNRADWALDTWYGNQSRKRKTEFEPVKLFKNWPCVTHPACAEGKYIHIH